MLSFVGLAQTLHKSKPNIIYILADDMGPGDVFSYNNDSKISTPNIDRLANEGMKFMDAHTSSGVCTPTRYGIITGRYSWRTKMKQGVLGGQSEHLIDTSRETIASLLKKQGYQTACIGKWHLGMDWQKSKAVGTRKLKGYDLSVPIKSGPLDVGFDYYFGISGSLNMSPHAFIDGRNVQGTLEFLQTPADVTKRGFIGANTGWSTKEFDQDQVLPTFTKKTCDWIKDHADKPFFVYMPLNSPHSPIVPSKDFKNKSGLNDHGDFCMETDWVVGEVLKTLDELGIADNTIVIFTADNGTSPKAGFPEMAKKGHHSSWIYRGMKGTNWEGGHRMPFVVRWPNNVRAQSVSNQLICTTDLLATCAEVLGISYGDHVGEDSVSFLPALKEKDIPELKDRAVIHHSDKGVFSVRYGKWKLMFDNFGGSKRGDPRKDEVIIDNADLLLFDMENDATENVNLASKYPEIVEQLKMKLADVIKKGRSTEGAIQQNDPIESKEGWKQINVVKEYLN